MAWWLLFLALLAAICYVVYSISTGPSLEQRLFGMFESRMLGYDSVGSGGGPGEGGGNGDILPMQRGLTVDDFVKMDNLIKEQELQIGTVSTAVAGAYEYLKRSSKTMFQLKAQVDKLDQRMRCLEEEAEEELIGDLMLPLESSSVSYEAAEEGAAAPGLVPAQEEQAAAAIDIFEFPLTEKVIAEETTHELQQEEHLPAEQQQTVQEEVEGLTVVEFPIVPDNDEEEEKMKPNDIDKEEEKLAVEPVAAVLSVVEFPTVSDEPTLEKQEEPVDNEKYLVKQPLMHFSADEEENAAALAYDATAANIIPPHTRSSLQNKKLSKLRDIAMQLTGLSKEDSSADDLFAQMTRAELIDFITEKESKS